MSGAASYKFSGSNISVLTSYAGSPKTITAITKANPAVVTSTAHGLANGDVVKIAGVVGMTEVNGKVYVIKTVTANTFELTDTDSTGFTTYVSGGTASVAVFTNFCGLTQYSRSGGSSAEIDDTSLCSTAKEFLLDLPDFGTTQLDFKFALNGVVNAALAAYDKSKDVTAVRIVLPNSGGTAVQLGYVQQTSESAGNGTIWTGSATIRNSGSRVDLTA